MSGSCHGLCQDAIAWLGVHLAALVRQGGEQAAR